MSKKNNTEVRKNIEKSLDNKIERDNNVENDMFCLNSNASESSSREESRLSVNNSGTARSGRDSINEENTIVVNGKVYKKASKLHRENTVGRLGGVAPKAGYSRYWAGDMVEGRIQHFIDLGYVPATDEEGNEYEPRDTYDRKNNKVYKMHLFEIQTDELERLKKEGYITDGALEAKKQEELYVRGQAEAASPEISAFSLGINKSETFQVRKNNNN